jgi:hypothetical protein
MSPPIRLAGPGSPRCGARRPHYDAPGAEGTPLGGRRSVGERGGDPFVASFATRWKGLYTWPGTTLDRRLPAIKMTDTVIGEASEESHVCGRGPGCCRHGP